MSLKVGDRVVVSKEPRADSGAYGYASRGSKGTVVEVDHLDDSACVAFERRVIWIEMVYLKVVAE